MTKQEFLEVYGKSVYQTRLQAALNLLARYQPSDALELADQFVALLQSEKPHELANLYV